MSVRVHTPTQATVLPLDGNAALWKQRQTSFRRKPQKAPDGIFCNEQCLPSHTCSKLTFGIMFPF